MSPFGIEPETEEERRILADPEWLEGARYGGRMPGHPEARVADHVREVLANVDRLASDPRQRLRLRVIALVHDAFKHRVRWWHPARTDHAKLARAFAEKHVHDGGVLTVIELHDEAYRAWRRARRTRRRRAAERRAQRLVDRLGSDLPLFRAFYRCDNETGSKVPDDRRWFEAIAARRVGGDR